MLKIDFTEKMIPDPENFFVKNHPPVKGKLSEKINQSIGSAFCSALVWRFKMKGLQLGH